MYDEDKDEFVDDDFDCEQEQVEFADLNSGEIDENEVDEEVLKTIYEEEDI